MSSSSLFRTLLLHWQWVVVGAAILLMGSGIVFFWIPEYSRMQRFDPAEMGVKEQERQGLMQTADELRRIQKSFDALDPTKKEQLYSLLPRTASFTQLLMTMKRIAEQAGFSVESFSMQEPQQISTEKGAGDAGMRVQLQVRVAGRGYEPWKSFLFALERQLPLIDFVSTQFKPESQSQDFSLVTYILP